MDALLLMNIHIPKRVIYDVYNY